VKMRILVVDDDDISLKLLKEILSGGGYEVMTAANGREATDVLRNHPAHVVITDWMMPVMDGIELCRWVRSQSFPWYVYVIMLTSRNQAPDAVTALKAGGDEFLAKPIDPEELKRTHPDRGAYSFSRVPPCNDLRRGASGRVSRSGNRAAPRADSRVRACALAAAG